MPLVCGTGKRISHECVAFSPADVTLEPASQQHIRVDVTILTDAAAGRYAGLVIVDGAEKVRAVITLDVG